MESKANHKDLSKIVLSSYRNLTQIHTKCHFSAFVNALLPQCHVTALNIHYLD